MKTLNNLKFFAILQLFLSVALGAFGAHALKSKLLESDLSIWQTATQYLMVHGLAALVACLSAESSRKTICAFLAGNLIFSGSLYALCLTQVRGLGAITPIGGILFLCGWASFAVDVFKNKKDV